MQAITLILLRYGPQQVDSRPVRFARHAYWPGSRYPFAPGT